ncbi:MAG: hypothetical protein LBP34_00135 [Flavobacteriaceae bacterium]|nr:hypothetical protein [Flavobacteriaceae bacterium]
MYTKIQKYLLLNYPLLWNTKVVPMGLTVIGFNVLFFLFGFIFGTVDFQNEEYHHYYHYYYYNENTIHITFKLISGLASILILIVWLIYYLKNNAFKSFYPKKAVALYWEWGIIVLLVSANCLYPFSYTQGFLTRERSYASSEEASKTMELIHKVDILLPESDTYYDYETASDSTSTSLLNYDNYYNDYDEVKKWLKEGKQDSIRSLMTQYFDLQKKHNLTTNLDVDTWMKLIYNPPDFPVSPRNYIGRKHRDGYDHYVEYNKLRNGYDVIHDAHYDLEYLKDFILITLYVALFLSVLLFSFRVTDGKSWLKGVVAAGILIFSYGIITTIYGIAGGREILYLTIFYWSALFLIMLIYVGNRILKAGYKGRSSVVLNLILWMIPCLPMFYYAEYIDSYANSYRDFLRKNPEVFFGTNLIFVVVIVFFFVVKGVKKWRALPEE